MPNQAKVLAGLARDDLFTVVLEQFVTDTARYADVILPVTTQIEHLDLMPAWGHLYLTLNQPAIEPRGEALPNTEIFRRLARALGLDQPGAADERRGPAPRAARRHPPPVHGRHHLRAARRRGVDQGGPSRRLAPARRRRLPHPERQGRAVRAGAGRRGLDPLPTWTPAPRGPPRRRRPPARYPLSCLTSKRHQRFLNSSYQMLPAHTGPEGEPRLEISAADAAARDIAEGDRVRVWNDRGAMELVATISDRVRPQLVSVPFGWPLAAVRTASAATPSPATCRPTSAAAPPSTTTSSRSPSSTPTEGKVEGAATAAVRSAAPTGPPSSDPEAIGPASARRRRWVPHAGRIASGSVRRDLLPRRGAASSAPGRRRALALR